MPGVNCGRLHRLDRRPAEVEKRQRDAAKRFFPLGGVCVRCARGDWRVEAPRYGTVHGKRGQEPFCEKVPVPFYGSVPFFDGEWLLESDLASMCLLA